MKRLLALCGLAALLAVPVAAAKGPVATLTASCGTATTVCPAGQTVGFQAANMATNHSWEVCVSAVNQTSPCLPIPIGPLNPDGSLTFQVDGGMFRTAGTYSVYLFELFGRNFVPQTSVTLLVA